MKKIFLGILITLTVLAISGVATAGMLIPADNKAKENGKADIPPVIEPTAIGEWNLTPPGLEKIEFIHYKKDFAKPEPAKAPKAPTCYKFLTVSKVKWPSTVSYVINPVNPRQTLDETFVTSAISTSAKTWDDATDKELMNGYTVDRLATYGVRDYKNAIVFGNYPTNGVIAVTTVWYNPVTKAIVEFDVEFDTDYIWGDANVNKNVMDLQNIATHELGHGVGLADVYDSVCLTVTMFGYSDYGDIIKRTLEAADIKGLQTLYGL